MADAALPTLNENFEENFEDYFGLDKFEQPYNINPITHLERKYGSTNVQDYLR